MRALLTRPKRRKRRGSTLLEGMIASAVLAFGITGAMHGIIFASNQNSMANRRQRASAVAEQVVRGLEARTSRRLLGAGNLLAPGNCSNDANVKKVAGDLASIPGACVIDFDAFEQALVANGTAPIVADYPEANAEIYRRVLVYQPMNPGTPEQLDFIGVVIGWQELGSQRQFSTFMALHDPTRNLLNVEL